MNPAMRTLSPASTRMRVEMLASCEPGEEVGVGVGLGFGVAVGIGVEVAVGVGLGLEVGAGVAVGVAVAVAVGIGLGLGLGVGVGVDWAAVCTNTFASSRLIQPQFADQTKPRSCPVERITRGLPVPSKFT